MRYERKFQVGDLVSVTFTGKIAFINGAGTDLDPYTYDIHNVSGDVEYIHEDAITLVQPKLNDGDVILDTSDRAWVYRENSESGERTINSGTIKLPFSTITFKRVVGSVNE